MKVIIEWGIASKLGYFNMDNDEMTCTLLSPLSVLYIGVVPTTSNSMQLSHSQCSTPLFQQVMSPASAEKSS
jgi:hypothetical protein